MMPCRLVNSFQLSPWTKAFLGTLIVSHQVKKFKAIYENRTFVTAFTRARSPVVILSQIKPVQPPIVVLLEDLF